MGLSIIEPQGLGRGLAVSCASPFSYFTTFGSAQTPMSEGGIWVQGATTGLDWNDVNTSGGNALGAQASGSAGFDDALAHLNLAGFGPNHQCTGTAVNDGFYSSGTHEMEVLLRFSISAHVARGYEVNYAFDGAYTEIVRWEGALGSFTYLSQITTPSTGAVQTGDQLIASIVGDTITVWLKRGNTITQINTATDTSAGGHAKWSDGFPGVGFWHTDNAAHLCFSDFLAVNV